MLSTRLTMFGAGRDRPLHERLDGPEFSQSIPAEFAPFPALNRPDPVGHALGTSRPVGVKDAADQITTFLLDAEVSDKRAALLSEWLDLSKRIETFIAEAMARRKQYLRREIAELTPKCRASLDRLRELQSEAASLEGHIHALDERCGSAKLRLNVAVGGEPSDDTFPTDEEVAKWQADVNRARTAFDREERQRGKLQELIETNATERRAEAVRLNELKQHREDCRAELEGRPRKGPFGLQVPSA